MTRHEIPMRDRILDALAQKGPDDWLSGEAISRAFGVSRAAVSKHVMSLREEGNIIESVPRRGYRLISRADPWAGDDVREKLRTKVLGQTEWRWLKETGSTNQVAALEAMQGAPEGLVVVARRQSEGRGSRGHRWLNLPGSLCFSVLTKPNLPPERLGELTRAAMDAVAEGVRKSCGLALEKRLPNDLFLNGRKVTGILVETMFHNSDMQWAVMGIGVNVNVPSEALPEELAGVASSLYAETGTAFSVSALLRHILEALEARLDAEKLPDDVPFSQTKNGPEERR